VAVDWLMRDGRDRDAWRTWMDDGGDEEVWGQLEPTLGKEPG